MPDLFDLSAKISIDAKSVDSTLANTEKHVKGLEGEFRKLDRATHQASTQSGRMSDVFRGLTTTTGALQGPLNGVTGRLSSLNSLTTELTTSTGALGAGLGLLTALTVGLGVGLLALLKHSADVAGSLKDVADQTNFTTETLSTLQVAGKRSGSELSTLSSSLIIFQKNQGEAQSGNKELAKAFKDLNVDIHDNEKGLRDAFTALYKLGATTEATTKGAKLFGRGIKDVQGVIKETNGDIDAAMAKYSKWGGVISTETAMAADQFNDTLQTLTDQIDASSRALMSDALPVFTSFLENISGGLITNTESWRTWRSIVAGEIAIALGTIQGFVIYLESLGTIPLNIAINTSIEGLVAQADQASALNAMTAAIDRAARMAAGFGGGGGGRGGRGGGGGGAKTDPSVAYIAKLEAELAKLSDAYNDVDTSAKLYAVTQEIANGALKKAKIETQDLAKTLARDFDRVTKQTQAEKELTAFLKEQNEAVRQAISGDKSYFDIVTELIAAQFKLGEILDDTKVHWLEQGAAILANKKALEMYKDTLDAIMLGGVAGEGLSDDEIGRRAGAAADRAAGAPPPNYHQQLLDFQEQMRQLAGGLTNVIDNAISDGFQSGIKAGLRSFALGILDLLHGFALKMLEDGLTEIFSKVLGGGSGGGGLLDFLGNILIGAAGGAAGGLGGGGGGGISVGGGAAAGGTFGANEMFMVGERGPEMLYTGNRSGTVIPNHELGGTVHNHYHTWNIVTQDAQSFASRPTQYQIEKRLHASVMKVALTG